MAKDQVLPTESLFLKQCKEANIVPIWKDYLSDSETPLSVYSRLSLKYKTSFLFESVEQGERIGRYSVIGLDPAEVLTATSDVDVSETLRERLKAWKLPKDLSIGPFSGGYFGFLGYECASKFESIKTKRSNDTSATSIFVRPSVLVIFDHHERSFKIIVLCAPKSGDSNKILYSESILKLHSIEAELGKKSNRLALQSKDGSEMKIHKKWKSPYSRQAFIQRIKKVKEYIRAGDCIQVVLSQPFDLGQVEDDFAIYRNLRVLNPSPYMFYFRHKKLRLIGASPEMLVRKKGFIAELSPIAGTRARGADEAHDKRLEQDLKASVKENAEHLMLVDLGRNDLGRVCRFNSIKVASYAKVEKFSHVMHLVSRLSGVMRKQFDAIDLLRAAFPAGTVTGAPKIRAMEIISELEKCPRGAYAGGIGYLGFDGDMDICIVIRTIIVDGGKAIVQAGAGIVYDSDPEHEYQETLNKASALFQAVASARKC